MTDLLHEPLPAPPSDARPRIGDESVVLLPLSGMVVRVRVQDTGRVAGELRSPEGELVAVWTVSALEELSVAVALRAPFRGAGHPAWTVLAGTADPAVDLAVTVGRRWAGDALVRGTRIRPWRAAGVWVAEAPGVSTAAAVQTPHRREGRRLTPWQPARDEEHRP